MNSDRKIEFGDFQTPQDLAGSICALVAERSVAPDVVLEPTCGVGSFLVAAANSFPRAKLLGWDINAGYVEQARQALRQAGAIKRSVVTEQDFFKHEWGKELTDFKGRLLILGNLPWVTNAGVSVVNGGNLPAKQNFQGFRGIEARTGKSNFDISEWMLIQLVNSLRGRSATIAMLCKTAIARKLLRFAWQNDGRITSASLYRIDAKKHFNASVDACLLLIQTGSSGSAEAPVFDDLQARTPAKTIGLAGSDLVSDVQIYRKFRHFEGLFPYQWRSGVKHDCSSVMELRLNAEQRLLNKLGEEVKVEPDFLYPLLKCSDLANGRSAPQRFVLITQKTVGEDTAGIQIIAPRTWNYLQAHKEHFEARKSSIYASRMPFALFGIGDYSFAPWKVAVSGLHKTPRFLLIGPYKGRPMFFDDTCYFLPFQTEEEAAIVTGILNSDPSRRFISSLLFEDAKRPITVELLQRLNLQSIAREAGLADKWNLFRRREPHLELQAEFMMELPGECSPQVTQKED